jgi:Cu-Zn family superoxide dismutase
MLIKKGVTVLSVCFLVCLAFLGIRNRAVAQHEATKSKAQGSTISKAVALLYPTKGSKVEGRVTFTEAEKGIHVHAEISGLTPGEHGFHVHEYGVWSEDGMAAGGHYNPAPKQEHGKREAMKRHVGDLGNIKANANGNVEADFNDTHLSFYGPHSIIGRGLVVHEKADDYGQPVGNAGGRVAVGAIVVAKP